jgi:hypothetical protein
MSRLITAGAISVGRKEFSPSNLPNLTAWYDVNDRATVLSDGAAGFDVTKNQSLEIVSNSTLQAGNIDFSIAAWIRPTTISIPHSILSKSSGTMGMGGREYSLILHQSNSFRFAIREGNNSTDYLISTPVLSLSAGSWYFVVAWHDSINDTINIQVNNGAIFSTSHALGIYAANNPLLVGREGSIYNYANAALDSVFTIKKVLSADERTWLYNAGAGRVYSDIGIAGTDGANLKTNLVSWWDLDEESGIRYDSHGTNHLTPVTTIATDQQQITSNATINYGDGTIQRVSQSFVATKSLLDRIGFRKDANVGTPTFDTTITIETDNAGNPSGTAVATATDQTNTSWNILPNNTNRAVLFPAQIPLTVGATYHIVFTPSAQGDGSNYRTIRTNSAGGYADGSIKTFDGTSWSSALSTDIYFTTGFTITSPTFAAGIAAGQARDGNYARGFDGVDDRLNLVSNSDFVLSPGDSFEVNGWYYVSSSTGVPAIFSKGNGGNTGGEYVLYLTVGTGIHTVYFSIRNSTNTASKTAQIASIPNNSWINYSASYDYSTDVMTLRINNSLIAQTSLTGGGIYQAGTDFAIGAIGGGNLLTGRIDAMVFAKRVLTSGERTSLFNSGKGLKYLEMPSSITGDTAIKYVWDMEGTTSSNEEEKHLGALGHNRMAFDGTNDNVSFYVGPEAGNYFGACRIKAKVFIESLAGNRAVWSYGFGSNRLWYQSAIWRLNRTTTTGVAVTLGYHEVEVEYDSTGAAISFILDGAVVWTGVSDTFDTTTEGFNDFFIGSRASSSLFFAGTIWDFSIYNSSVLNVSFNGYGNTNADWLDTTGGGKNGTVGGSPIKYRTLIQTGGVTRVQGVDYYSGAVSKVLDKSGNNRSLLQATFAARPIIELQSDGNYMLSFDGVDDNLRTTSGANATQTIYVVLKYPTASTTQFLDSGTTVNRGRMRVVYSGGTFRIHNGSELTGPTITTNTKYVLTGVFNGASSEARVNLGTATTGNTDSNTATGMTVGATGNLATYGNPFVAGILRYSGAHTTAEQNKVIKYLNKQYQAF